MLTGKRLNRKKLIADFEQLRSGFSSAVLEAIKSENVTMQVGFAAHYFLANRRIVELGGEGYQIDWLIEYYKSENKEMCKALKGLIESIENDNKKQLCN